MSRRNLPEKRIDKRIPLTSATAELLRQKLKSHR